NGSKIGSGTVPTARLGSGTADSTTFLRGDSTWTAFSGATVPTGAVSAFAGFTAPAGWYLCDGSTKSRTTDAALFAVVSISTTGNTSSGSPIITSMGTTTNMVAGMPISGTNIPAATTVLSVDSGTQIHISQNASGTTNGGAIVVAPYGIGDGSTTFNLPDMRGRGAYGRDDMGGSAANRVTSGVSGIAAIRIGASGGDQNLHQHNHTSPAHSHAELSNSGNLISPYTGGGANTTGAPLGDVVDNVNSPSTIPTGVATVTINNTG